MLGQRRSPFLAANAVYIAPLAQRRIERIGRKAVADYLAILIAAQTIDAGIMSPIAIRNGVPVIGHPLQRTGRAGIIGIERQKKFSPRLTHRKVVRNMLAGVLLPEIADRKVGGLHPIRD